MTLALRRETLADGLLGKAYDDLTPVQRSVVDLMAAEAPTEAGGREQEDLSRLDRLADQVAAVGGSWSFIAGCLTVLIAWAIINLVLARSGLAFDPYPFIFLNLVLSMVAALQAPIIIMSQNRQAARDRDAAEHDYKVNLRAELEIMHLHDRLQRTEEQLARVEKALSTSRKS